MQGSRDASGKLGRVRIDPGQTKHSLRVVDVSLSNCRLNPNQPRKTFDPVTLQELAASIEQHGLLQPITIKRDPRNKEGFIVIAGERRFRAHEILRRETIPAVVTSGNADEIALIENLQREDLSPLEEAEALERLRKKYNYTQEELAKAVGKARSTVTNLLKLTSLPRKVKKECSTSNIATRSFLIELSKLDDSKKQLAFWNEAKERGVTVREARARKKLAGGRRTPSETQRTLTIGKRFVGELERLVADDEPFEVERYDELLDLFKRFVAFVEREAAKHPS
jgi:ParB family chromosome partitioning protein